MSSVRIARDELTMLRKGVVRQVRLERRPEPMSGLLVYSPACYRVENGERVLVAKRESLHVIVLSHERHNRVWRAAVRAGAADERRLLRARPGASGGDYTTNPARAMQGEPEAVSVAEIERQAKDAARAHRRNADWAHREALMRCEAAIGDLLSSRELSESAAKRVKQMRLAADRLRRELR